MSNLGSEKITIKSFTKIKFDEPFKRFKMKPQKIFDPVSNLEKI